MLIDSASKHGVKLPINSCNSIQPDTFHTVFEFSPVFFLFQREKRQRKRKCQIFTWKELSNYLIKIFNPTFLLQNTMHLSKIDVPVNRKISFASKACLIFFHGLHLMYFHVLRLCVPHLTCVYRHCTRNITTYRCHSTCILYFILSSLCQFYRTNIKDMTLQKHSSTR